MSLLFSPWFWLSVLLSALGIFASGYHLGGKSVQADFDTYVAEQKVVVGRITSAWNAESAARELAILRSMDNRERAFAPILKKSHDLPSSIRDLRIPAAAVGMWDDAVRAANAAGAAAEPAKAVDAAPADTSLGLLSDWITEAAKVHAECVDRVLQWQNFYSALRAVNQED